MRPPPPSRYFLATTILLGATLCYYNRRIMIGMEFLVGIETIVGWHWVLHLPNGECLYTNPMAYVAWQLKIILGGLGLMIAAAGLWFYLRWEEGRPPRGTGGILRLLTWLRDVASITMDWLYMFLTGVMFVLLWWIMFLPKSAVITAKIVAALSSF